MAAHVATARDIQLDRILPQPQPRLAAHLTPNTSPSSPHLSILSNGRPRHSSAEQLSSTVKLQQANWPHKQPNHPHSTNTQNALSMLRPLVTLALAHGTLCMGPMHCELSRRGLPGDVHNVSDVGQEAVALLRAELFVACMLGYHVHALRQPLQEEGFVFDLLECASRPNRLQHARYELSSRSSSGTCMSWHAHDHCLNWAHAQCIGFNGHRSTRNRTYVICTASLGWQGPLSPACPSGRSCCTHPATKGTV